MSQEGERPALRSRRSHERSPGAPRLVPYLYLLPAFALYAVFALAPLGHAAWLSFFNWDGVTPATWAGFGNYRAILSDHQIRSAFLHSFVLVIFYSLIPISIGLLLAGVFSRAAHVRGLAGFRTVLFLPQVIPTVALAVTWRWIFGPDGPLDQILRAIGLGSLARPWLGDFTWALPAVGVVGSWVMYGLCMVLFIAGVQKIPQSLYDAARVDGAGAFREFFAVTLPGLRNELVVAFVLTLISALRSFDLVYVMTKGGPGTATDVPALEVYARAFEFGAVGSAAAVATTLALLIFAVAFLVTRLGDRRMA
jgi:raffinose/stachyose/melibiose transport system permease protein